MFFDTGSVSKRKSELSITIGLIDDDIIFLKFTAKPHLHEIFLEHYFATFLLFSRGYSLCFGALGLFVLLKLYQSALWKRGLLVKFAFLT